MTHVPRGLKRATLSGNAVTQFLHAPMGAANNGKQSVGLPEPDDL